LTISYVTNNTAYAKVRMEFYKLMENTSSVVMIGCQVTKCYMVVIETTLSRVIYTSTF